MLQFRTRLAVRLPWNPGSGAADAAAGRTGAGAGRAASGSAGCSTSHPGGPVGGLRCGGPPGAGASRSGRTPGRRGHRSPSAAPEPARPVAGTPVSSRACPPAQQPAAGWRILGPGTACAGRRAWSPLHFTSQPLEKNAFVLHRNCRKCLSCRAQKSLCVRPYSTRNFIAVSRPRVPLTAPERG